MSGDWGDGERKTLNMNMTGFNNEQGLVDAFTTGFAESVDSGPTASVWRFLRNSGAIENLSGAEANEKYNLTGTPIAYKDDEKVSDYGAETASNRHFDKMMNQATLENADTFGSGVAEFAGSLAGGFVDPINLAVGGGTAAMAKSAVGTIGTRLALTKAITNNPWTTSVVRNTVDNMASTIVTDLVAIPLGESVTREEVTTYQRAMNIAGGVMFGTLLGVGMDAKAIRGARKVVDEKMAVHGSDAPEVLVKSQEHGSKNVENGKTPNQSFVEQEYDIINTTTRPDQTKYVQQPITSETIHGTDFFVAKKAGSDAASQVTGAGKTGYVVTDNANLASNQVTPTDGSSVGSMTRVTVDPKAKILTQDLFNDPTTKMQFEDKLVDTLKKYEVTDSKAAIEIHDMFADANDINQIADSLDNFFDGTDGTPSSHDLINETLQGQGFDGYAGRTKSYQENNASNTLVVFDKKHMIEGDTSPTVKFDKNHPDALELKTKLDAHRTAEKGRLNSHESDLDYDAKAVENADKVEPIGEADDTIDNTLEGFGLDKDNLDDVGFSKSELSKIDALKTVDTHENMATALLQCMIGSKK